MTKEELLEMVNSTIVENGKKQITGKSLNLALTEIVNSMGTGSGGSELVYFIPSEFNPDNQMPVMLNMDEDVAMNYIINGVASNITLYEKISQAVQEFQTIPINVDMSLIYSLQNSTPAAMNSPASVLAMVVTEQAPGRLSWNPTDHYNIGDIAICIMPQYGIWTENSDHMAFWLLPNGYVELVNQGE